MDAIAAPRSIGINAPVTLGTFVLNDANRYAIGRTGSLMGPLTMVASVESALIDVRQVRHAIDLPLTLPGPTKVDVAAAAALTVSGTVAIGPASSLTKSGPGTLDVAGPLAAPAAAVVVVDGTLKLNGSIGTLGLGAQARGIVGDLPLTIDTVDSADGVRASIAAAYRGGAWDGPGIAAGDPGPGKALGYRVSPDAAGGTTAFIKLTLQGDTNLDGTVDFADLVTLAQHYNGVGRFVSGDSNYDGLVIFNDLVALAQNYGASLPGANAVATIGGAGFVADWALATALVPEPTTLVTITLAAAADQLKHPPRPGGVDHSGRYAC